MSEEEKKAINVLKNMFFDEYEWAIKDSETTCYTDPEEAENSINSALNLIEKQQEEIEELTKKNKELEKINYRVNKNLLELAETSINKDRIREKIKEIRDWDKEIGQENGWLSPYQIKVLEELLEEN